MSPCRDGLSSDQYFLVNFIMSNYLGPDVYHDNPRISASQRLAKGLPPYTLNHIGSSSLTIAQLQCLYSYVLRNAKSSLLLHPDMIYMYLKGYLPLEPAGKFPQFTYFFPTNLHAQKRYSPSHEIVKGIVVIDDPTVAISKEELQRFRCLSRLNDLKIDRAVSLSPRPVQLKESRGTEEDCSRNGEAIFSGVVSDKDFKSSTDPAETCKRKKEEEAVASHAICVTSKTSESQGTEHGSSRNGEAAFNGLVSDQDYNSSAQLQVTCKRKKEEEAISCHAICVTSKTLESQRIMEYGSSRNGEATSNELVSDQDHDSSPQLQLTCKRKEAEKEPVADHSICGMSKTPERYGETYKRRRFKNSQTKATNKNGKTRTESDKTGKPTSMALVPIVPPGPSGTATIGTLRPSTGAVDIGVNKVAYFFRVALPGFRKDEGEFSCEIESDGKVTLKGSRTGEKTINRYSRVFKMRAPPGPFKICFSLPGPVDPRLFSPVFRSDGIFEAVIIRHNNS